MKITPVLLVILDGFGYREQQLESNRYRVTFSCNSVTPRDTVQN